MITKYEDPWLYYTVDNYFPYEIFESMSESIQSFIKTGYKNLSESQNGILHTSREIMNVIGNNALSSFNRLAKEKAYSLYNIEKKDRNTYNEIKFMEAGGNYPKHDERNKNDFPASGLSGLASGLPLLSGIKYSNNLLQMGNCVLKTNALKKINETAQIFVDFLLCRLKTHPNASQFKS